MLLTGRMPVLLHGSRSWTSDGPSRAIVNNRCCGLKSMRVWSVAAWPGVAWASERIATAVGSAARRRAGCRTASCPSHPREGDRVRLSRVDADRARGVEEPAFPGQSLHVVERAFAEELRDVGLDGAGVDGGAVPELGFEVEDIRQQALALAVAGGPGHLQAGRGDAFGDGRPRTFRVVLAQQVQGGAVDQAAPLHRPAEPDRGLPVRRTEHRDRCVWPDAPSVGLIRYTNGTPVHAQ